MVSKNDHIVIAIGASAGGLEAIHEFFDNLPGHPNLSFIIVQHLSPDYKSLLVELISRHTHMQVDEASDDMVIEKNHVYVIPNNKMMTISNGKLMLEAKRNLQIPNNAVDVFLTSLAADKKNKAVAVILSGTGSDGTKGVEAIKSEGGLVIIQDPLTARFDGMPNSAIHSGNADLILAPSEMPAEILQHLKEPGLVQLSAMDEKKLDEVFSLIYNEIGQDFHFYKLPTLVRRITRRMSHLQIRKLDNYIELLRKDTEECRQLGKDFLIGVTRFFRDTEAFDLLTEKVLIPLVAEKETNELIKIWVCACSTGEEAYSIAIALDKVIAQTAKNVEVKIFATDIDEVSVSIASGGLYTKYIEKDIDAETLSKYFIRKGEHYQIISRIRKQVVFAKHDVTRDPPFINNDLVTCRNMLIYMSPVLQQKVLALLLFSVSKTKYLFLGSSENSMMIKDSVLELNNKWKLYKKTRDTKIGSQYVSVLAEKQKYTRQSTLPAAKPSGTLWDSLKTAINEDLHFAAFFIDQTFDIKESVGNYERFLSLPKKSLQLNLLSMIPSELYFMFSTEIKKAWKQQERVTIPYIRFRKNKQVLAWHVVIKPMDPYTMVVINEIETVESNLQETPHAATASDDQNLYISGLESELAEAKSNLQFAVEDLETTNEELQSSNEELLSANEELQSSNEELQSLNEELHTLNTEHQLKIKELVDLNDDLNNYFRSTDIGQLFLDKSLHIRKFNAATAGIVNLIESDIGRPIAHISNNIRYDSFMQDLDQVLRSGDTIEKEVSLSSGKNYLIRMMPYVSREKESNGIIISFVDITVITNLNNIIRGVLDANPNAIIAFTSKRTKGIITDFQVTLANHTAATLIGKPIEKVVGLSLKADLPFLDSKGLFGKLTEIISTGENLNTDVQIEAGTNWFTLSAAKILDGFVISLTDITARKTSEEKLRKNYAELIATKDRLKTANEELESKVTERTIALSSSEERFRLVAKATNDALWDWNLIDNSVWYGETFYKLFGFEKTPEVQNKNFWRMHVHPEDRDRVNKSLNQAINTGKHQWTQEYRFRKQDDSWAHILDRSYIMHDEFGTPYRMLGSMFDVTELKQAEAQVAATIAQRKFLAESMPLIVWIANERGQVNFVNRQFEIYTGQNYKSALGNQWQHYIHDEDLPEVIQCIKTAVEEFSDFEREIRLLHHSGKFHWNLMRTKVSQNISGQAAEFVITITDINHQKTANEELERKVDERTRKLNELNLSLEQSNHDLQQFASIASHDLQEPLRKIQIFTKLLADKHANDVESSVNGYLTKIISASTRMKLLITDILDYSKLSSEETIFQETDLNQVLADTLEDFELTIKEMGAEISSNKLPVMEVIPGQIRQIFQNLVSNAMKFVRPGVKPKVTFKAIKVASKDFDAIETPRGNYCRIEVRDNGIGFDKEFSVDIFNLFQRLHSKDKYEGTGIGLAITKKIVEKHHGIIKAEGKEGEGANFVFVLPIQQNKNK